MPVCGRE
ncbi:hypothetical protein YPPY66_3990, partial [Yersinia pestis PY-66]